MTKAQDPKGTLRAAFAQRMLTNAKDSLSKGVPGLIVRAALVTLFVNLLVIGYLMMGALGLIFVSLLFLMALSTPLFVQMARKLWNGRRSTAEQARPEMSAEAPNEG